MRVPVLKQQSVAARNPFGDTSPNLQQANLGTAQALGAVAQDVGQLGQSIGNVMEQQAREERQASAKALHDAEVAKRRAEELQVADGLVDLQRRVGDDESKFLGRKGLDAVRASGGTLDAFDKYVEEGAKRYTDPTQKLEFQVRAKQALLAARRSVESHTTREYAAGTATTFANLRDAAVRNAGSVDLSPAEMASALAPVDQAADEFFPAELAKTAKTELRADMAEAVIQRHLEAGNIEKAKAQLEADRSLFAPKRATQLGAAIDRANAGAEKDRVAGEVAKLVDTSAEAVRTPDGYVTEEALRKAVPVEGYEGQQRDQVEAEIRQRLQLERAKLKADGDKHRDNVNRADLQGVRAGESEVWLEKYDPDFLLARQARKRAEFRAWKASQGDAKGKAAEARLQKAVDQEFLNRLNAELINDPSTKPDDFLTTFIAEKAKQGDDVMVSDVARARAGLDAAKAGKRADSTEGATERAVANRFERTLGAAFKQKGKPLDQKLLNERVGRALGLYRERLDAKGKPLDEAELAGLEAEMLREVTVSEPGRFLGTNDVKKKAIDALVTGTEPSRPMPAGGVRLDARPTASGKNGERYRLSDDGKSWEIIK
jgi:hypothetical protein